MAESTVATEVSAQELGVQDPSASKPCGDCADDEEKSAGSATSRLDLLAREQLAGGTADQAIALTDPDFKATRSRSFDGPKPTFKVS